MTRTIANEDLTESDLPAVDAELNDVLKFAATFDWTSYFADITEARRAARACAAAFRRGEQIDSSLEALRAALMLLWRGVRYGISGGDMPNEHDVAYAHALVEAIRTKLEHHWKSCP